MGRRVLSLVVVLWLALPQIAAAGTGKLDATLAARAAAPRGMSRVILTTDGGIRADTAITGVGGLAGRSLPGLSGQVALVPDASLLELAGRPEVVSLTIDRPVAGAMERTAATVGAAWVRESLGFDGSGVGIAIIDSGVTNWHDDLADRRIVQFVDFVSNLPLAHDGYGHGTHVAGIIAGSGYDSGGARRGIAPGANLVVLRVLDGAGDGHISDVIAAIDYAIEQRVRFNIRIINLSVAAGVYESYRTDPLTLAAKRATDAGLVVVTAGGNHGRGSRGQVQYGGISSPGNAPWVLTVGASNHQKTTARGDDIVAPFSSRGPTLIDRSVKPDLLAPGVAIESLSDPGSTLFTRHPEARQTGTVDTAFAPYLSLTGTSMAAPVVTGTVALMLEANPSLTPNLVKAILHYTAERRTRVELAAQGAGFLNARGAVQLAAALGGGEDEISDPTAWSRQILWGNQRIRGGTLTADASAWREDVTWGSATTPGGQPVTWGHVADSSDPWGARGAERLDAELDSYATDAAAALWDDTSSANAAWAASQDHQPLPAADNRRALPAHSSPERRRKDAPTP
jgi:subtilisin family serine protease